MEVINNTEEQCFEINMDNETAELTYSIEDDVMIIPHTFVPKTFEGKGVGSLLAKTALDYAKANNLKVVPLCPFIDTYIQRHPEYKELTEDN